MKQATVSWLDDVSVLQGVLSRFDTARLMLEIEGHHCVGKILRSCKLRDGMVVGSSFTAPALPPQEAIAWLKENTRDETFNDVIIHIKEGKTR